MSTTLNLKQGKIALSQMHVTRMNENQVMWWQQRRNELAYAKAAFRNDDEGHTGSAVVQYVSGRRLVVVQSVKRRIKLIIMLSFSGLLPKQRVDLLFYPVFVVRSVSPSRLLEHQAAQIRQLKNEKRSMKYGDCRHENIFLLKCCIGFVQGY